MASARPVVTPGGKILSFQVFPPLPLNSLLSPATQI